MSAGQESSTVDIEGLSISYLRRKLEREGVPRVIHTVRGIGYVLRDDS